jgi:hypothetical protein
MEFICDYCNKSYKSYQSRWNHINKYHNKPEVSHNKSNDKSGYKPNISQNNIINKEETEKYTCKYCDNSYKHFQSRWKHEQKCKETKNETKINNKNLEMIIEKQSKELKELKVMLQKALKIHPKTLQKINNQLNNNGIINNNNIVIQIGNEDFNKVLSEKEKLFLLNKYTNSIVEMVKMVHISDNEKFKPYKSMYITNLQNNVAYKYDDESKKFIAVTKSELLDSIIDNRLADIENFHEDYKEKITPFTSKQITKFIEKMTDEKDYKDVKKEEIKFAIYNGREEIIQQIKENNPDLNIFT